MVTLFAVVHLGVSSNSLTSSAGSERAVNLPSRGVGTYNCVKILNIGFLNTLPDAPPCIYMRL